MAKKKRKDGLVQVQADIGIDKNGKRKRKSFYGKTLTEARMRRDAWREEQKRKEKFDMPDITLGEWSSRWLESVKETTEPSTYRGKSSAIAMQNEFEYDGRKLGEIKVVDIRPIHLQSYMQSLASMSNGTIRSRRTTIKSILNAAMANDIISKNPWQNIKCPKGTYEGHENLDDVRQKLIIDTWNKRRAGLWALTMMYTGMRREELAALRAEDIDFNQRQIHIHRAIALADKREKGTKTEAGERVVPIFQQLYEPLRSFTEGKNGLLFLSAGGEQLTATSFRQAWNSYMLTIEKHVNGIEPCNSTNGYRRDAAIKRFEKDGKKYVVPERFTAHDLRYTYATILYDAGVDIKTAAYLLGHADITVTMAIYTKLSHRKKLEGLDALNKYMETEYLKK